MLRPRSITAARYAALARRSRMLWAELRAASDCAQNPRVKAWRDAQGFTRIAAAMGFGGGCTRIVPQPDGTYRPAEPGEPGGLPAILFYVWEGQAPGRPETLLDLAAWVPQQRRVFTRLGLADVLGEWALWGLECLPTDSRQLRVFRDPIEWAAAGVWEGPGERGGHGVCILDWNRAAARLRQFVNSIDFITSDIETGRRLREALTPPPPPCPSILVAPPTATDRSAA